MSLKKALEALDDAGEMVRLDEGAAVGILASVEWDGTAYTVVQA